MFSNINSIASDQSKYTKIRNFLSKIMTSKNKSNFVQQLSGNQTLYKNQVFSRENSNKLYLNNNEVEHNAKIAEKTKETGRGERVE